MEQPVSLAQEPNHTSTFINKYVRTVLMELSTVKMPTNVWIVPKKIKKHKLILVLALRNWLQVFSHIRKSFITTDCIEWAERSMIYDEFVWLINNSKISFDFLSINHHQD